MIRIRDISKSFGPLKVLDGVSFDIGDGQIVGLVGPNGCGKTTLIKTVLGLVLPDSGEILIDGRDALTSFSHRAQIGYMPQNPNFPANLTISELLSMIEDVRGQKAVDREELTELFHLRPHFHQAFGVLSGGTKQRVAAVLAQMFRQRLLILDEPTVGLDPISARKFKQCLKRSAERGQTVVMVSHIMSEIEQLVSHLVFLLDGRVQYKGTIENLAGHTGDIESAIVDLMSRQPAPRLEGAANA